MHSQSLELERTDDKVVVKLYPKIEDVCITFTFTIDDVVVEKPILYAGLVEENITEKYKAFIQKQLSE